MTRHPDPKVQAVAEIAGQHLTSILDLFKPGARIALAVWHPEEPEMDFVLIHPDATNQDAIDTFQRRIEAA
jgi:hypothetical protein